MLILTHIIISLKKKIKNKKTNKQNETKKNKKKKNEKKKMGNVMLQFWI